MVYTPLKTRTVLNTEVGAVVGAIPPLMGWAAATGTIFAPEAAAIATLLFCWQFPHFHALAWRYKKDYARGGYKMLPVLDAKGSVTGAVMMAHAAVLAALPAAATYCGVTGPMFAVEGSLVGAYLLRLAWAFYADPKEGNARRLFQASLWYLPLLLLLLVFHSKRWKTTEAAAVDAEAAAASDALTEAVAHGVAHVREGLRGVCLHEILKEHSALNAAARGGSQLATANDGADAFGAAARPSDSDSNYGLEEAAMPSDAFPTASHSSSASARVALATSKAPGSGECPISKPMSKAAKLLCPVPHGKETKQKEN